jgi:hypothetical protein
MNVAEFIAKWRKVELKERSAAQEHFLDLCSIVGHPTPAALDPTGASFCFEKGAAKQDGGDGFADVWKRGFFGWEYKGRHKDLAAAYSQLLLYRDALESPPLLVVCDLDQIVVHTNFTGTVSATHAIPLESLADGIGIARYPRIVPKDAACAASLAKRTLTALYNTRPTWLATCHAKLDAAVAAAYGWPADLQDDQILERLLTTNRERD